MTLHILDQALLASGITEKRRYAIKEVKIILGTSFETLRKLLKSGSIRGQKVGRNWKFVYHDDLKNYLEVDGRQ